MSKAIHIDGQEYPYKVFRSGVKIRLQNGKYLFVSMTDLTGWSWDGLEKAGWGGYTPPIKPSDVKEWLEKNISD